VLVRSILSASGFSNAIYGFATNPEQWQICAKTLRCFAAHLTRSFDHSLGVSGADIFFAPPPRRSRSLACAMDPTRSSGERQARALFPSAADPGWRRRGTGSRTNCCSRPLPGAWRASNSQANRRAAQTIHCAVLQPCRSGFGALTNDLLWSMSRSRGDPACRGRQVCRAILACRSTLSSLPPIENQPSRALCLARGISVAFTGGNDRTLHQHMPDLRKFVGLSQIGILG